jgi:hypothetical protein
VREITPRQRYVNNLLADARSIFQIAVYANHFIGLPVIPNAPPDGIAISENPAFRNVWGAQPPAGITGSPRPGRAMQNQRNCIKIACGIGPSP